MFLCKKQSGTKNRFKYSLLEYFLFLPKPRFSEKKLRAFKGKTIVITGASFGIGEALALLLAASGVHLILVARTESKLNELKASLELKGAKVTVLSCNFYDESEVDFLVNKLKDFQIDILVNNAGKSIRRSVFDSIERYHDFSRLIHVNYSAPLKLTLSLLPVLEKQKGHVVNVSSFSVLLPAQPFWASYSASKAAFNEWFESVSPELESKNISTSVIYFPLVKTRMIAPNGKYQGTPAMNVQHAAEWVFSAIAEKKRRVKPWWSLLVEFIAFFAAPFIRLFNRKRFSK